MGNDKIEFLKLRLRTAESKLGRIKHQESKGLPHDPEKRAYFEQQIKLLKEQIDGQTVS